MCQNHVAEAVNVSRAVAERRPDKLSYNFFPLGPAPAGRKRQRSRVSEMIRASALRWRLRAVFEVDGRFTCARHRKTSPSPCALLRPRSAWLRALPTCTKPEGERPAASEVPTIS